MSSVQCETPMQNREQQEHSHANELRELGDPYYGEGKTTMMGLSSVRRRLSTENLVYRSNANPAPISSIQNAESVSSAEAIPLSSDIHYSSNLSGMVPRPDAFQYSLAHNPKRAYRQRRKDPSCDACRDRKVKCDATETTSCTECSSRNVRCQFTKDTNRRMSSIKQVQDLEKQLQDTRTQLERLRASQHFNVQHAHYNAILSHSDVPDISRSPRRMLKARLPQDLSVARAQLSDVGRGILKPPIVPSTANNLDRRTPDSSILPPREITQHCLDSYLDCVHKRLPVVHWPSLCRSMWSLYSQDNSTGVARETLGLCLSILGLGALFSPDERIQQMSRHLVQKAYVNMDFLTDHIGIDQGLSTFLISLYLSETNARSTSWVWLGSSIRIAQDKGFHVQGGNWSSVEGEMRKRIWYSLYVSDRLMAMEMGRPMLIADEDCDTEYPEPLEDEEEISNIFHSQRPTILLACIHVCRLLPSLARLCRSLCITTEAIKKYEAHLAGCMQLFPPQIQIGTTGPLDPFDMTPLLYFQNARLLLYRHNMSPACSAEQRLASINHCALTAQETANILSRCFMNTKPHAESIELHIKASASSLVCTHLWRCMLFLAFRQLWHAFNILLRYVTIIGDTRSVNISCGRHLSLFLHLLINKHHQGVVSHLEEDEDLIVLLSGDLQAGTSSWVWGNTETGTLLSRRQKHSRTAPTTRELSESSQPSFQHAWSSTLTDEEQREWGGWQRLREAMQQLENFQQNQDANLSQLSGQSTSEGHYIKGLPQGGTTLSTRSRMAIASITDA